MPGAVCHHLHHADVDQTRRLCIVRWCMRLVLQVVAYVQKFGTKQWARIAQVQHFLKNKIAYPRCSKFSTYCSLLCVLALVITAFRSNT